jgi:hypothetical protein
VAAMLAGQGSRTWTWLGCCKAAVLWPRAVLVSRPCVCEGAMLWPPHLLGKAAGQSMLVKMSGRAHEGYLLHLQVQGAT